MLIIPDFALRVTKAQNYVGKTRGGGGGSVSISSGTIKLCMKLLDTISETNQLWIEAPHLLLKPAQFGEK